MTETRFLQDTGFLFDAGTTEPISDFRLQNADFKSEISNLKSAISGGRPYFVMELVKGEPITKYCDSVHLPIRDRLELFTQVCSAIQHAHQKGIIHRDIKPSNVLVCMQDGKPVPKVIDFGVAKALHQKLAERTMYTAIGQIVGTLEYMSPEQAELSAMDIDTRADVYALGVLLYELLTGSTPLDKKRLRSAAYSEMVRIIKEEEPPKPSTRLSESKESLASLAAQRRTEPARLTRQVRGELDWIVMKALEKDRTRRYETASGLARDIERHLHDEPVEACPPSTSYRLRKLARKYKKGLALAGAFAALLIVAVALSTWQAFRATRAEAEALIERDAKEQARQAEETQRKEVESQRDRATSAEKEAKEQAAVAQAVNDFVQKDLLGQADLENQPGGAGVNVPRDADIKVRTVLDRAAKMIEGRFASQPRVEAAIRLTIANAYLALGHSKEAQLHAERSVALRTAHLGADHRDTLTSKDALAGVYLQQGFFGLGVPGPPLWRAEALCREVLEKRTATLGPDHLDTLTSKHKMGSVYLGQRKFDLAEPLLQEVVQKRVAQLGAHDPETLRSKYELAGVNYLQRKYDLAEAQYIELIKAYESKFGEDHPGMLHSKSDLAAVYEAQRKYAQAERLALEVLQKRIALQGPGHPETLGSKVSLGLLYRNWRKYDLAVPVLEEAVAATKASLGEVTPLTRFAMHHLALAYRDSGKPELALPPLEQMLAKCKENLSPDHNGTLNIMTSLAGAYLAAKMPEKAVPLFEQVLAKRKQKDGQTLYTMNGLAGAYLALKMPEKAITLREQTLTMLKEQHGIDDPRTLAAMHGLARTLVEAKQPEKALPLVREYIDRQRKRLGAESEPFASLLAGSCLDLLNHKHYPEAEKHLRECLAIREKKDPDWNTFNAQSMLGEALLGQQKYADAEPLLVQGYEGMKQREAKIPANAKVRLTEALERLVQFYEAWGKPAEAAKWRKELEARKAAEKKDGGRLK